jgi:kynurenine formamidase
MKELEEIERARRIRSIPFALRIAGIAVVLNLIPLGMAFNAYNSDFENQNLTGVSHSGGASHLPPLDGTFSENFSTVVNHLIDPAQKDKAIGLKIFLFTIPLGLIIMMFGFIRGPLRYLVPLLVGLAIATGLNHILLLIIWEDSKAFSPWWFIASSLLGVIAIVWGGLKTVKQSVLLRTGLHLTAATALALLVTLLFPFILGGLAIYLNRKRDIPYSEFFGEAGNFYNFLIMNIYPICFQIVPAIRMVKQKGKSEEKLNKKKYRKTETPVYHSELDFSKLQVGDVLLSGKPSWRNSAPIQASNILSSDEVYRFWSHCLIYAGSRPDEKSNPDAPKRNIVESQSNGKGVQEIDLLTGEKVIYEQGEGTDEVTVKSFTGEEKRNFNYDEAGNRKQFTEEQIEKFSEREKQLLFEKSYLENGYYLMVLRPRYVDSETLERVVEFCRQKDIKGCGYDTWGVTFYSLCALVPPMLSGWLESRMAEKMFNVNGAYFCSELVADAFVNEKQQLFDRSPWRVKPLDFRLNPMFEEIDCGYRRIPVNESAKQEVAEQIAHFEEQEIKVRKMAETCLEMEKAPLERIEKKFKLAGLRVEKGLYPGYPMS